MRGVVTLRTSPLSVVWTRNTPELVSFFPAGMCDIILTHWDTTLSGYVTHSTQRVCEQVCWLSVSCCCLVLSFHSCLLLLIPLFFFILVCFHHFPPFLFSFWLVPQSNGTSKNILCATKESSVMGRVGVTWGNMALCVCVCVVLTSLLWCQVWAGLSLHSRTIGLRFGLEMKTSIRSPSQTSTVVVLFLLDGAATAHAPWQPSSQWVALQRMCLMHVILVCIFTLELFIPRVM